MRLRRLLLGALVALGFGLAQTLPVAAAALNQSTGITMSPSEKDIELGSGLLQARTSVSLTNHTGQTLTGTIRLLDFKTLNETGGLIFTQAGVSATKYGLAKWMSLPNGPNLSLPDGQSLEIPVIIDNRADLAPGGHYGAVVITFGGDDKAAATNATFRQELVSLLLVSKTGGAKSGLALESLTPGLAGTVPTSVKLRFRSTGNTHVIPHGFVTLTNEHDQVVAKAIINSDSLPVLPGSDRNFVSPFTRLVGAKSSRQYRLTAYYRYDGQDQYSSQSVSIGSRFSTLDYWPVAAFIAIVLIGVCARKPLARKFAHRYRAADRR